MKLIRKLSKKEIQIFNNNLKRCPLDKEALSVILQVNPEIIHGVGDTMIFFKGEKIIQNGLYCDVYKEKTMYYVVISPMGDFALCYSVY